MDWHKVLTKEELDEKLIPVFGLRLFKVHGKNICLAHNLNGYFAVNNSCPHAGGDLSQGVCEGSRVVCPVHRYAYDLKTGRGAADQGDAVRTYPVEEREDGLYVGIKDAWGWLRQG